MTNFTAPISSVADVFTAHRLRHPKATIAVTVLAVLGVLGLATRGRRHVKRRNPWVNLLVVLPVKLAVWAMVISVVMVAAGVYLVPRGVKYLQARMDKSK